MYVAQGLLAVQHEPGPHSILSVEGKHLKNFKIIELMNLDFGDLESEFIQSFSKQGLSLHCKNALVRHPAGTMSKTAIGRVVWLLHQLDIDDPFLQYFPSLSCNNDPICDHISGLSKGSKGQCTVVGLTHALILQYSHRKQVLNPSICSFVSEGSLMPLAEALLSVVSRDPTNLTSPKPSNEPIGCS